jgi:hypothetical protein
MAAPRFGFLASAGGQSWTRDPVADAEQLMADLVAPAPAALP